jgi:ParB family chromosome partitioning protein
LSPSNFSVTPVARPRSNPTAVLKDAASVYKVDTDSIEMKVRQEFAVKARAKKESKPAAKVKKAA